MGSNPGDTALYRFVWRAGGPFRFRVVGHEQVPDAGPAIYVSNHLDALGPIMSVLSIPVRFYPWIVAEQTDYRRAPRYLYDDFVSRAWHLNGRLGIAVSWALSRITVPLLTGLGCVSVDSTRHETLPAFRRSLELLTAGENLLIFPEEASSPEEPESRLHQFQCGFIGLCSMYGRTTGGRLPIYPVAVHAGRKTIAVGQPVFHENGGDRRADVQATCDRLHQRVRELYLALEAGEVQTLGKAPETRV
jgi:1-acyl-sn-glycerol-3-phosphate acyltransferase